MITVKKGTVGQGEEAVDVTDYICDWCGRFMRMEGVGDIEVAHERFGWLGLKVAHERWKKAAGHDLHFCCRRCRWAVLDHLHAGDTYDMEVLALDPRRTRRDDSNGSDD